nr:restriction endonuclease subunit S [uncultured Draconibacterium sp.]
MLFSIAGTKMGIADSSLIPANTNQALAIIRSKGDFEPSFLKHYLMSANVQDNMERIKVGVAQSNLSLKQVSEIKVPKVTIAKQRQIVSRIEKEQELVNANKQLIEIFEKKIKDRIAKVWDEEKAEKEQEFEMAAEPETEYKTN